MGVICVQLWTETNDVTLIVGTGTEKCVRCSVEHCYCRIKTFHFPPNIWGYVHTLPRHPVFFAHRYVGGKPPSQNSGEKHTTRDLPSIQLGRKTYTKAGIKYQLVFSLHFLCLNVFNTHWQSTLVKPDKWKAALMSWNCSLWLLKTFYSGK